MPWNGSGVFARIYSWIADRDAGLDILADRMDQDTDDIAQGLMHCLTVNGETVPVANLPMANYRHTGAAAGVADGDYATVGQVKNGGGGIAPGGFLPIAGGTLTGALVIDGAITATGIHGDFIEVSGAVRGNAGIFGAGGMSGTNLTLSGHITADYGTFTDHITVAGTGSFGGHLEVDGSAGLQAITGTTLTLSGAATAASLGVSGNASAGTLGVSGAASAGSLSVAGAASLHAITGTTLSATTGTFTGNVGANTLSAATLSLSGNATAAGVVVGLNAIRPTVNNAVPCGVDGLAWSTVKSYNFDTVSDRAQKRDIAPLPPAGAILAALDPCRFRWAAPAPGNDGLHCGFVAQDVARVMAAAGLEFAGVAIPGDGTPATLCYDELVPVLWKACQELARRLEALEAARS